MFLGLSCALSMLIPVVSPLQTLPACVQSVVDYTAPLSNRSTSQRTYVTGMDHIRRPNWTSVDRATRDKGTPEACDCCEGSGRSASCLSSALLALWFLNTSFQFRNLFSQSFHFRPGFSSRRSPGRRTQKAPHHFHGRQDGRLDIAEARLHGALHFLISVEGRLEIPHHEFPAHLIRCDD